MTNNNRWLKRSTITMTQDSTTRVFFLCDYHPYFGLYPSEHLHDDLECCRAAGNHVTVRSSPTSPVVITGWADQGIPELDASPWKDRHLQSYSNPEKALKVYFNY